MDSTDCFSAQDDKAHKGAHHSSHKSHTSRIPGYPDRDEPIRWYGTATDLAYVAEAIQRARRGEVDYLAVCPPSGVPVAVGGIDYTKPPGAATVWQLSVRAELRSCGIGTLLIGALEQRARDHGLRWVELGVDDNNPRPRTLYERLGYAPTGNESASWNQQAPDGSTTRYETRITLMRKQLS